jgi:hypothetical protein
MLVKTLRRWIGLGVLLGMMSGPLKSKELPVITGTVKVSVYDDAGIGPDTLVKAEDVASEVFRHAGLEVEWLNCGLEGQLTHLPGCGKALFPTSLQLRLLKASRRLTPETFGISYLSAEGEGCYSQVFLEPVERLHRVVDVNMAILLGHVAAHEVAHLLLGSNSHSVDGLMKARWGSKELVRVSEGALTFDQQEGRKMVQRLMAGARRNAEIEMAAAKKCDSSVAPGDGGGVTTDVTGSASGTD